MSWEHIFTIKQQRSVEKKPFYKCFPSFASVNGAETTIIGANKQKRTTIAKNNNIKQTERIEETTPTGIVVRFYEIW